MTAGQLHPVQLAVQQPATWQLLAAFTLGGAVSGAIITADVVVKALGIKNVQRGLQLVSRVLRRIWRVSKAVLSTTGKALVLSLEECLARYEDSTNCEISRWARARAVLVEGVQEVRRSVAEGKAAIEQELALSSAVVGQPGLVTLQYMLNLLTPLRLAAVMQDALRDALVEAKEALTVPLERLELRRFSIGDTPPQLLAARAWDVGATALAIDLDIRWESQLNAELLASVTGVPVPVSLRNVRFDGPVRLVVTNLTAAEPGYGAMLLSLPSRPSVSLDCSVAYGELTRLPWLRGELERAVQQMITDEVLWPRRTVVPAMVPTAPDEPVLGATDLERLTHDDPLLRALAAQEVLQLEELEDDGAARPAFDINLGVLGGVSLPAVANFSEFNWTQQLQLAAGSAPVETLRGSMRAGAVTISSAASTLANATVGLQEAAGAGASTISSAASAVANATVGLQEAAGEALTNATSALWPLPAPSAAELRSLFAALDADGSGAISLDELARGLREVGISMQHEEVVRVFDEADADGNGEIDFEEFVGAVEDGRASDGGGFALWARLRRSLVSPV